MMETPRSVLPCGESILVIEHVRHIDRKRARARAALRAPRDGNRNFFSVGVERAALRDVLSAVAIHVVEGGAGRTRAHREQKGADARRQDDRENRRGDERFDEHKTTPRFYFCDTHTYCISTTPVS